MRIETERVEIEVERSDEPGMIQLSALCRPDYGPTEWVITDLTRAQAITLADELKRLANG